MANNSLIVGAGPTGLTMAIELLRLGIPVRLIDKSLHPAQFSQALVIQARALEQFERYGIADEAVRQGRKLFQASIISEGRDVVKFDFHRIPGRYPYVLFLPQSQTEKILTAHLEALGGRIERGTHFLAFRSAENDFVATLQLPDGTHEQWSGPGSSLATELIASSANRHALPSLAKALVSPFFSLISTSRGPTFLVMS